MKEKKMQPGDWVYSYTAGIWRLHKIVDGYYEDRWCMEEPKKITTNPQAVCTRICTSNFKRSFRTEVCAMSFIHAIERDDLKKLKIYTAENPNILDDFEKYKPKDYYVNMTIDFTLFPAKSDDWFDSNASILFEKDIEEGLTNDHITGRILNSPLGEFANLYPLPSTNHLVFYCRNHESQKKSLIYRGYTAFSNSFGREQAEKYGLPKD